MESLITKYKFKSVIDQTDYEFRFIIGMDCVSEIKSWYNYEELLKICIIDVITRNIYQYTSTEELLKIKEMGGKVLSYFFDYSSSEARKYLSSDLHNLSAMIVGKEVFKYIEDNNLYQ
ncbi:MAG: nicotinate-nicotinamide nucleotide adenylyltransferase, partial [bacterium]